MTALLCCRGSPTLAEQVSDAQWALLCSLPRQAWDLAVDICLSQLPTIIEEGTAFRVSPSRLLCGPREGRFLGTWSAEHCRALCPGLGCQAPPPLRSS